MVALPQVAPNPASASLFLDLVRDRPIGRESAIREERVQEVFSRDPDVSEPLAAVGEREVDERSVELRPERSHPPLIQPLDAQLSMDQHAITHHALPDLLEHGGPIAGTAKQLEQLALLLGFRKERADWIHWGLLTHGVALRHVGSVDKTGSSV